MHTENRFNLIDEPWIPVVDTRRVSLKQIFSDSSYRALGGNPIQKIAITKLLLAIGQAAYTPIDDDDWAALGSEGLAQKCLNYLEQWHDRFWLYGEKPFLQMSKILNTKKYSFGNLMPIIAAGNTTILNQSQVEHSLDNSDRTLLLIQLMGFALGGKQADNSKPLTQGYIGNRKSGRAGRSAGYLHSYLMGSNLQETLHLNLLTQSDISDLKYFQVGVGTPPWEKMPDGELCQTAIDLKDSYMGSLVPLCRFIYINENGIHNSDGILYDRGSKQAPKRDPDPAISFDPMLTVDRSKKDAILLWANPTKRPWRELTSLLSFISDRSNSKYCLQHKLCVKRLRKNYSKFSIWAGGMNFSDKAGEHAPRKEDDFVESSVTIASKSVGDFWYAQLSHEMSWLEDLSKIISSATYKCHRREIKESKERDKRANKLASNANMLFWQLCERHFQTLVDACIDANKAKAMRKIFAKCVHKSYDSFCSKNTARQLDAWAKHRPKLNKYLSQI